MTAIASKHHSFGALPAVITRIATEISEFCTNFAVAVEVARMVDGHNEVPLEARRLLGFADEK